MATRSKSACQCHREVTELKNKVKFHEAEMMKMKQQIFELQRALNGQGPRKAGGSKAFSTKKPDSRAEISKRLQKKGGCGHFYEQDQCVRKGGQRDEMSAGQVKQVLNLLSLGQEKVNFKFIMSRKMDVAAAGWKLEFNFWSEDRFDIYNEWFFSLIIKENGEYVEFKAVVEVIKKDSGDVIMAEDLYSTTGVTFRPGGYDWEEYYARFNVTIL